MPKASKKKRQEKAQDFKKVKLKVGKKKALSNNFTDTSFQSKSIVLSGQSITQDKSSELTNARNLTLGELLVQLKHFSPSVRKDAIAGLRDILTQHPKLLKLNLSNIINSSVKMIIDNDNNVRKSCQALYEQILESLAESDISPFASIIVAFICAGMTHILEEIRTDSLKFLGMLVPLIPNSLGGYANNIMPNFFSLLSTSDSSQGSKEKSVNMQSHLLSQGSRLTILKTCCNYMRACVDYDPTISFKGFWFMDSKSFFKERDINKREWNGTKSIDGPVVLGSKAYFDPSAPKPYAHINIFSDLVLSGENSKTKDTSDKILSSLLDANASRKQRYSSALEKLYPFLQANWMELAPPIFGAVSKIPTSDALNTCHFIIEILKLLWRTAEPDFSDKSDKNITNLLNFTRQCMVYFPFGESVLGVSDQQVDNMLIEMNLGIAEIVTLFITRSDAEPSSKLAKELAKWKLCVVSFIQSILGVKSKDKGAPNLVSLNLKQEKLLDLLPAIWWLYNEGSVKDKQILLKIFVQYSNSCHALSECKALSIEFLATLIKLLTDDEFSRAPKQFVKKEKPLFISEVNEWILTLPKVLWQLKSNQPKTTSLILQILSMVFKRHKCAQWDAAFLDTLQSSLIPFFYVLIPNRGPVFGPFTNLGLDVQKQAIELLYYCPNGLNEKLASALKSCLDNNVASPNSTQISAFTSSILGEL